MTLPGWVPALVRSVVPAEFAEDLLDDLEDGWVRRSAEGRRAWWWLLAELARTPYVKLRLQARRLRAAGTRREMPPRPARTGGSGWGAGLRVAARALRRRPTYAIVSVLTLTVSIGAATLIFSVLEGVLLRPLPYDGADRVYRIWATNEAWKTAEQEVLRQGWDRLSLTEDMAVALRGSIPGGESLGAYTEVVRRFDDGLPPARIDGAYVLFGLFETLPMAPLLGRLPTEQELEERAPVLVLSERLWIGRYGRDPDILGRAVSVDGDPHTVIGVLPGAYAVPSELTRWWSPLPPDWADGRTDAAVFVGLVRLAEGTDIDSVTRDVLQVSSRIAEQDAAYATMGVRLGSLSELLVGEVRQGITLLFWAVVAVVLIACVNLANLVVARGSRRTGELAMRAALGASRRELVWSVLAESVLICAVGGGLGVLAATQLLDPFVALLVRATPDFPRIEGVGLNPMVLLFATGVAALTATLAGLPPALVASRRSPWEALQHGRRSRGGGATRRTQRFLLFAEASLAMALLAVAGLLTRSAFHVASIDPGYDPESVAYIGVETGERYGTPAEAYALGEALEARLSRLPGATVVARSSALPGIGGANGALLWPVGGSVEDATLTWATAVSQGYFEALGIPLLGGRGFTAADGPDDPKTAVVSELFARRFFGEDDPVGRTVLKGTGIRLEGGSVVADGEEEVTIVGVAADVRQLAVIMDPEPGVYFPIAQTSGVDPKLVLRTDESPSSILQDARAAILAEDPGLLITEAEVLQGSMRRLLGALEVRLILIVALATLAAFLTVVGIYGVVAYIVSDQTHEIGVRMALGARSVTESTRMVLQALVPVLVGSVLGLGGAYGASRLLEDALFGVGALDPLTYGGVLSLLIGAATAAAWIPSRRAAAVDPMRVLTEE